MQGEFVFVTVAGSRYGACAEFEPVASIMEKEGLTLVIPRAKADEFQLGYDTSFKRIAISVDESMAGLVLTAAFAAKLTEHGINASLISGAFHEHLFVPSELLDNALLALSEIRL